MRYGIAVWNYMEPRMSFGDLVGRLAAIGFGCMSLQLHRIGELDEAERRGLSQVLEQHNLQVTLHANFPLFELEHLQRARDLLGPRLLTLTLDAASETTSAGTFFSMTEMRPVLDLIAEHAPGVGFGVEDFPLDAAALEFYRKDLEPLLANPKYGMLLDLGHLNLRQHAHPYFQQTDAAAQIADIPVPILEVHIHDNNGQKDLHQHLHDGNADLAGAARGLREIGFTGISTIEVCAALHDSTPAASWPGLPRSLEIWRELVQLQP